MLASKGRTRDLLLLLLITIAFFWRLSLTKQFTWLDNPDLANQVLPWFELQAREWHNGSFPLWDPHHWGGQSLIGQMQPGAAYPLNWLLFLWPLRGGRISPVALNYYFVLIHFLGAAFFYLLCRDLGCSSGASMVGGLAFGAGGYVGSTDWPQMLNGAVWAPLVLLFFLRAARGERPVANAALSGGALGVSLLSGHHQVPIFIGLTIFGLLIYYGRARRNPIGALVLGGMFLLFAALIGAFQTLPAYDYWRSALRWVSAKEPTAWGEAVPYAIHARYSLSPVSVLGVVFPGIFTYSSPLVGAVPLALAVAGVVTRWREEIVRIFCGVAFGGLVFAFGGYTVPQGVLYSVLPLVDKARTPAMATLMFEIGIFVLAAIGLDSMRRAEIRQSRTALVLCRVLVAFAGVVYLILLVFAMVVRQQVFDFNWIAMAAFAALTAGVVLSGWIRSALSEQPAIALLVGIMLLQFGSATGPNYRNREDGWPVLGRLYEHDDIAEFLKAQPGNFRVSLDRHEVPYNFGDWHGVDEFAGYNAGVSENVFRFSGEQGAERLLGVSYSIGRKPANAGQMLVFQGKSGLRVYKDPEALPRFWTVHRLVRANGLAEMQAMLRQPASELRMQAFVTTDVPPLETCEGDESIDVLRRDAAQVLVKVNMACRGIVVIADTFAAGWRAWVDHRPAAVHEVYGMVRGIVAERGEHIIDLRYQPRSVALGAFLSLCGLAGLVAVRGIRPRSVVPR